jgi:subtilisin family serine protease
MMRTDFTALILLLAAPPVVAQWTPVPTQRVIVHAPRHAALMRWLATAEPRLQFTTRHLGRSAPWSSHDLSPIQQQMLEAEIATLGPGWRVEPLALELAARPPQRRYRVPTDPGLLYQPDDPLFGDQWGIGCADFDQTWELSLGRRHATLAILDTGVDLDHPELAANLVAGTDLVNNDDDPFDDNGHGTAMAAVAAAVTDNGMGMAGCIQEQIMPVKVLNAWGMGYVDDIAAGIDWAVAHDADVIAMGLVMRSPSPALEAACDYAYDSGVLLYAAAGSDGGEQFVFPAAYRSVTGIGAISRDCETRAPFSNGGFGDHEEMGNLELMAPGVEILTIAGGGYELWSGTALACAFASALGAAYRDAAPALPAELLRIHIQNHADPRGEPDLYGYGVIDAAPWVDGALFMGE